jgi:hypothetical protein
VGDAHSRIGGIDVLTARTRSAVGIDLEIGRIDRDLEAVVDYRIDPDRTEARVPTRAELS